MTNTQKYEVIESRVWQSASGRKVSIYGALPWRSEAERLADGWQIVSQGWTVRNPHTGEVGICRVPWKTREEAQEWADGHVPSTRSMYD